MKSEVFMLAAYLKFLLPFKQLHLTDCLTKTDEAQLGTYDELEWAMIQDQEGKSATDFLIEKNSLRNI
jgi:NAD+ synthase